MIETSVKEGFLELFYHDIEDRELSGSNKLNVFTLKITNNGFAYDELLQMLSNHIYHFALSRNEAQQLIDAGQFGTLVDSAKEKLRNYTSNDGELGEFLLYCMLESHLNAPKILTKLEIKTSAEHYVFGSDGVHLLRLDDQNFQILLGESKMWSKLDSGIKEAFKSIKAFLDSEKKGFEISLISSQLVKETFDDDLYKFLKKVIIPSAREDEIYTDLSFGIFLGFDIEITDEEKSLSNKDFREHCRAKIVGEIEGQINRIETFLAKQEYQGHQFYIYIIPFSDLKTVRKEMIQNLQ